MRTPFASLALVFVGCGLPEQGDFGADDRATSQTALSVSSADAAELLAFVNHASTTAAVLDDAIGLDARAVKAIVAHRDGPDAARGTADDDLFGSIGELDAVSYVGDAALKKLLAWAIAHPVATAETVEGVAFSSEQVSAVLWGMNQTTSDELDDQMGLETRAANALLGKAPFTSISQIGAVAYVGPAALTSIRGHAPVWAAKRAGAVTLAGTYDGVVFDEKTAKAALKIANTAAAPALIAAHRPYTTLGQVAAVSGVGPATMKALHALALIEAPPRTIVGDGAVCDGKSFVCGSQLVCAGLSYDATGLCRPSWMANTFRSGTVIAIPDNTPAGATMGMTVIGLATVPEDVIVHLEITHPRKQDLKIILTQPSSAEGIVWNVNSAGDARVVMGPATGIERDSSVNGVWTLTVIDTVAGSIGTLNGWSLELTSRMD